MGILSRLTLPAAVGYFLVAASFNVARDMFTKDYDADLDHHMYFGQRLLEGELIWVKEIYDKFPIIQYSFAIPAYVGSVRAWFVMSALMLLGSAVAVYFAAPALVPFEVESLTVAKRRIYALVCASFYAYLSTTTPPSLTHINSFTTSCIVVSVCMVVFAHRAPMTSSRGSWWALQLGSATLASFAIATRPFLGAPSLLLVTWIEVRRRLGDSRSSPRPEKMFSRLEFISACWCAVPAIVTWATLTAIALVVTNFAPYIAFGAIDAMLDGIMHNAQKLNPQSASSILSEQLINIIYPSNWYYILLFVSTLGVTFQFLWGVQQRGTTQNRRQADAYLAASIPDEAFLNISLGVIAPGVALETMILARHWWNHYWQMFVAIGLVNFMVMLGLAARRWPSLFECTPPVVRVVGVCAIALGTLVGASANQEAHHPQQAKFEQIVEFLNRRRSAGMQTDFLDIGDMYPHWRLLESRHGFPHAQNIQHIILGWYSDLHRMSHIDFPYTREELCRQVIVRGPTVIFMTFSYMFRCLLAEKSDYILERNAPELIIFVRA